MGSAGVLAWAHKSQSSEGGLSPRKSTAVRGVEMLFQNECWKFPEAGLTLQTA